MHHNCPVCFEYLFDSSKAVSVLHCGHKIHLGCLYEMRAHKQFSCPVCLRSACDMSDAWQKLDREVAASPMPAIYQKKTVNTCVPLQNMDPLQRLRDDIECAVPHFGAQVPRVQLLQHPADKRGSSRVLKSLRRGLTYEGHHDFIRAPFWTFKYFLKRTNALVARLSCTSSSRRSLKSMYRLLRRNIRGRL